MRKLFNHVAQRLTTQKAPVHTVLENVASPGMQAKLFRSDDPALVALYKQLREKTLQTLQGASKVSPKAEWEFVLHTARLYDRMGCDLLALDLGKLSPLEYPSLIVMKANNVIL